MNVATLNSIVSSTKNVFMNLLCLITMVFSPLFVNAQCDFHAYSGGDGQGAQQFTENLGLTFTVNSPVVVSQLGAFDHNQDGLLSPIIVGIIRHSDSVIVAGPSTFFGTVDTLIGNFRFQNIPPITLDPGVYTIVALGYGPLENNGNASLAGDTRVSLDTGNGLLTFNSSSYGGTTFGLPQTFYLDNDVFYAGTFSFSPLIPQLQVTINGHTLTSIPDSALVDSFIVCNSTTIFPNVFYEDIADLKNLQPDSLVKVTGTWTTVNATGPVSGSTTAPLSALDTIFPYSENWSLIDKTQPGSVTITFTAFFDQNNNGDNDDSECLTNDISFKIILNDTIPPTITCPANIEVFTDEDVCTAEVVDLAPSYFDNCIFFLSNALNYVTYELTGATEGTGNYDASSTVFNEGVTTIKYKIKDCGIPANADSCTFTVTVIDGQAPDIVCPIDTVIQLDPQECDRVVLFDLVSYEDNCEFDYYYVSTGYASGSNIPVGTHPITFSAFDIAGNESQCSFNITVNEYVNSSLGCINTNVSLDENCEALVDPFMVLTGFLVNGDTLIGCVANYVVNVEAPNGQALGNIVTGDYLGKTLNYTVTNEGVGFTCWGNILIEDKFAPSIVCRADTISCVEPLTNAIGVFVNDNCPFGAVSILLDEFTTNFNCDPNYLSRVTRIYTVKDAYGNYGDSCTHDIYIKRTNMNGIEWPENFTGVDALQCGRFAKLPNGNPRPSVTGVPILNDVALYPFNSSTICNGFVTFTDEFVINTPCKKMITRTWEVGEWWCNKTNIKKWVQIIEISDTEAPVIGNLKPYFEVSTLSHSCKGNVTLPAVTAEDNCNVWSIRIETDETPILKSNGGTVQLSAGGHTVTYVATDTCGNESRKTTRVLVKDDTEPIPVCETTTVVSLKDDGTAWLDKIAVDDGSFDECGDVELKIRRMATTCDTTSKDWVDQVGFCCADAGKTVMVALLVTDESGNTNQCMVSVEVQDKRLPSLTCPHDVTVTCTQIYDPLDLGATFGNAVVSGGGCVNSSSVNEVLTGALDQCRLGRLTRTFTLTKNNQTLGTCNQTITFLPSQPFTANMIQYPRDTTFNNSMCSRFDLDPDNLPAGYGRPIIEEDGVCNLVASSFDDDYYPFTGNGACFKIVRHWTVINWCSRDEFGKIWQDSFDQVIVVMNTIAPTITSPTTTKSICSYRADCTPERIVLNATATDDCTPTNELKWSWTITFQDGTHRYGTGRDASGIYQFGNHRVDFEVEDKCGNIARTGYLFESKSCKAPTAYCKKGLSTALVAMDTDGNGIPDAEMAILKPSFFDNGSYQGCGNQVKLSFSANVNDTTLTLSCPNENKLVNVNIYATDENGNNSFCATDVFVTKNNVNICPNNLNIGTVSGRISNKEDKGLNNVIVALESSEQLFTTTQNDGNYKFENVETDKPYTINPKKSDDYMNGINTLDLVFIQRHILNVAKISDPMLLLASDVNKDKRISASDIVSLRKLILGADTKMVDDESWRFIWDGQTFADPNNPLTSVLMSKYEISNLTQDMQINFKAYKVGDVNGSSVANFNGHAEPRSNDDLILEYDDVQLQAGQNQTIKLYAAASSLLHGMQATIHTHGLEIIGIKGESISNSNIYQIREGLYTLSFNFDHGKIFDSENTLIEFEVRAEHHTNVSAAIEFSNEVINTEAYINENLKVADVSLRSKTSGEQASFGIEQNIPNPWNNTTMIPVTIPQRDAVNVTVKDMLGRIMINKSMILDKGNQKIEINKSNLTSGSYIYEVSYRNEIKTGKMIVIE